MIFGSVVQWLPGAGIEEMSRHEILLAHVAAILTGAAWVGLAARATKK